MLFPIFPVANLLLTILPEEFTKPMFLIILLVPLVHPAVGPSEYPLPVNPVVLPRTFEHPAINPTILTVPMDVVLPEIPDLRTTVGPLKLTLPVLQPVDLRPYLLAAVVEHFHALAVLLVEYPVALVLGVVECVELGAVAVCFVVEPLPVVLVTFNVFEAADTSCSVIHPFSFLFGIVAPLDDSEPLFEFSFV